MYYEISIEVLKILTMNNKENKMGQLTLLIVWILNINNFLTLQSNNLLVINFKRITKGNMETNKRTICSILRLWSFKTF